MLIPGERRIRRDVYNATPLLLQVRDGCTADVKYTADVDVHRQLPLLVSCFLHSTVEKNPGTVDDNIEPPKQFNRLRNDSRALLSAGYITLDKMDAAGAISRDCIDYGSATQCVAPGDHHPGARFRKGHRRGLANT